MRTAVRIAHPTLVGKLSRIYSTFQVSEVHNRGRDTAVPCPYGNRRAIGVYFINVESAVNCILRAGRTPTPQEFDCFLTYNLNAEQLSG